MCLLEFLCSKLVFDTTTEKINQIITISCLLKRGSLP